MEKIICKVEYQNHIAGFGVYLKADEFSDELLKRLIDDDQTMDDLLHHYHSKYDIIEDFRGDFISKENNFNISIAWSGLELNDENPFIIGIFKDENEVDIFKPMFYEEAVSSLLNFFKKFNINKDIKDIKQFIFKQYV